MYLHINVEGLHFCGCSIQRQRCTILGKWERILWYGCSLYSGKEEKIATMKSMYCGLCLDILFYIDIIKLKYRCDIGSFWSISKKLLQNFPGKKDI